MTANFGLWGIKCSWSKNKPPLECGVFSSVALTPCIPLPAKRYKETASVRNQFIQKTGYSLSMFACVLLAEGSLQRRNYRK